MTFSQSLCFGEKSLQELEQGGIILLPEIKTTPNRSYVPNNSDSDIIEESPTNCSTFRSLRERTKKKSKKSKKKIKTIASCEQLTTSRKDVDLSKSGGLSQFFRSEYDFSADFLEIIPKQSNDQNVNCENLEVKVLNDGPITANLPFDKIEDDMFDESIIVPHSNVNDQKPSQKQNSLNMMWDDSIDLNGFDMNFCEIKENNDAMQLNLKVDENIALGLDNVT